jgi:hypothetical protein
MSELKKVPLFFADVGAIADGDIDDWADRMAQYVSRVTGLPLEEEPSTDPNGQSQDQSADQADDHPRKPRGP